MKKLYLLLLVLVLGFSCTEFGNFNRDDGGHIDYSVSEARDYYYRFIDECPLAVNQRTRGYHENSLLEIDISPDWHSTVSGRRNELISINVPIFDGREILAFKPTSTGDINFVHVVQKLIVVKNTELDRQGAYLMTLIPDWSFCPYPGKMGVNSFINSGDRGKYSGWVVYSVATTSYIVRLDYYKDGVKLKGYHVFGDKEERRASIIDIYKIVSGMRFGKISETITRAMGDKIIQLDEIEVPGGWGLNFDPEDPDGEKEYLPEWDDPEGPMIDLDPDPEEPEDPGKPEDPKPEFDPDIPQNPVTKVPCTESDEALATTANKIAAQFKANKMNDFIRDYQRAGVEYAQTLNYNPNTDVWSSGDVTTDNSRNSVRPDYGSQSIATIHNHPTPYRPHSLKDVYGLAKMNGEYGIEISYVVSYDGSVYALIVEDSAKAEAFYEDQATNQSDIESEYSLMTTLLTACTTDNDGALHALAYVLEKHETGMSILRLEENGFRARHTEYSTDEVGATNAKLTRCK